MQQCRYFKQNEILEVKKSLDNGDIIAVPTETVYGLAVIYDNEVAIEKLKILKKREDKAITMMIADKEQISSYGILSNLAKQIVSKYMPGEITLVIPKNKDFKNVFFDDFDTIGIRIPKHEFMLNLLKQTGPLLVTSANSKGEKPCLNSDEVSERLVIDAIIVGNSGCNKSSTVVKIVDDNIEILRQGTVEIDFEI